MKPPRKERTCSICGLSYPSHTRGPCGACGLPAEHHDKRLAYKPGFQVVSEAECWEARARMAAATRDAGLELTRTDREALRRCPNPPTLTVSGYQPRGEA